MGLFKHKKSELSSSTTTTASSSSRNKTSSSGPQTITYHITQSLSGTLTVTPTTVTQDDHNKSYTIVLTRPKKNRRDSIDICVQQQDSGATVGHCLIQVTTGKFLNCTLGAPGKHNAGAAAAADNDENNGDATNVRITHSGHGSAAQYTFSVPSLASDQPPPHQRDQTNRPKGQQPDRKWTWVHDQGPLHGAMVNADRRWRLEPLDDDDDDKNAPKKATTAPRILARFAGSSGGVSEFGMLEVYKEENAPLHAAGGGFGNDDIVDWCGLVILTAVSIYAREERHREKKDKVKSRFEGVGMVGDLLGIAGGVSL